MSIHAYSRNPLKRAVAEQIFVAQHGRCQLCRRERRLEIDHIDNDPQNWSFSNLRLLCHECNISERNRMAGQRYVKKGERETIPQDRFALQVITDSPHNPTAVQRALWDEWVRGKVSVPSQDEHPFPLLRGLNSSPPLVIYEKARTLARLAVHACGMGSNKTYWEYLMEDAEAKLFRLKLEKGQYTIAYSDEFAEVVLYFLQEKAKSKTGDQI